MKKPGKKRIERLVEQVSFATSLNEVDVELVANTYLYKLLKKAQESEQAFRDALEEEMETHDVQYS